eukprot:CAMPEP_0114614628 /NCGR_PEP_ID=MMETSP0168-20121206/5752_1 /TAXON_ID=95228 ORGANISM="Vannella sp., Strain DIVA3 517/6/12" /NCGR_SAMPLE_ID=MMETSP0168 /ASSEMBLY_ACC=CAM_ASM_000044 /LENGTH=440 /DNA_ID=CAMNT_0001825683 /DNA_START=54 /DNA_END=1372 /DNA_ORIENTATION=-
MATTPCPALDTECAPWAECYVEGILPCSTTLSGNLFLFLVYGFIMYLGAKITYDYAHKLLEFVPVVSTAVRPLVGVVNPLLSVLPVAAVIAACAFGGGQLELQQKRMNVAMGALAGSTIFSITIAWASVLLLGRCDIRTGDMIDGQLTDRKDLFNTGVSLDKNTRLQAAVMGLSVLIYCFVQASAFATLGEDLATMTDAQRPLILTTCIVAAAGFLVFLAQLQWDRHIFERRVRDAQNKKLVKDVIATFVTNVTRAPNMTAAALADRKEAYDWMAAVEQESLAHQQREMLNVGGLVYCGAMILCGVLLVVASAYPLVQSIMTFCERIGVNAPELYVSYFSIPVICNGSAYIALMLDASYKKKKTVSQSFSYLYGSVTLNNTCCLMIFTAILYSKQLVWTWSTEAMLMLAEVLLVGGASCLMTIYKTFWSTMSITLYVIAL